MTARNSCRLGGAQRDEPLTGHDGAVWAVAFGQLGGQPVALSAAATGRCGSGTSPPAPSAASR
jgi:hypothetical protein